MANGSWSSVTPRNRIPNMQTSRGSPTSLDGELVNAGGAVAVVPDGAAGQSVRLGTRVEAARALCAAVLASGIGAWVMELWRANLHVPFIYNNGDSLYELMTVKAVLENGWVLTNPNLAAPFGQESYDFPAHSGDSLSLVIIKALGLFSGDFALVTNVFFLLCFALIAMVSYFVLRRIGISPLVSVVIAVLFTILPARFDNGEEHLFLGAYYAVPIGSYLVLRQLQGRELFKPNRRYRGLRAYLTLRSVAILAVCAAIGSTGNYYALFTAGMMAMGAVLAFLSGRRVRPLLGGLVAVAALLAAVGLNGLPTLIYVEQHGRDTAVAEREPADTDYYGLVLTQLVLPIKDHRIPALAHLTDHYLETAPVPVPGEDTFNTLGFASVIGLLYLAVTLVACCVAGARGSPDRLAVGAALGAGMAFLIGTVGGLATLFAYVVNPQLRAPDRIAVFVGFFALLGLAIALERLRERVRGRRRARLGFAVLLVIVLTLGALDQTSKEMIPNYRENAARYASDASFVRDIEQQVPPDASIFELPIVEFPESPVLGWEPFVPYLHSSKLRWSYGAMTGRSSDWQAALANAPLNRLLPAISAAGFSGVYFNPRDTPNGGAGIVSELSRELGVSPLVSSDTHLYFFNMASYNQRLRDRLGSEQIASLAQATLHPFGG
jgi:phosphoglycerol transferase